MFGKGTCMCSVRAPVYTRWGNLYVLGEEICKCLMREAFHLLGE